MTKDEKNPIARSISRLPRRLLVLAVALLCAPLLLLLLLLGCLDPMDAFIIRTDLQPEAERPPNWPQTKKLMRRPAPRAGDRAADFTLATVDGRHEITRSVLQGDRPLVLVFGSFT